MSPLTCTDCGVGEWVAAVTADPPKRTWRKKKRAGSWIQAITGNISI